MPNTMPPSQLVVPSLVSELYEAVTDGDLDTLNDLIDKGVDVNISFYHPEDNYDGNTPLLIAIENDNYSVAEALLHNGADVNAGNRIGWIPLNLAVFYNNKEAINFLLAHGALPVEDRDGTTPLHLAALNGDHTLLARLLARPSNVDARTKEDNETAPGGAAIHFAAQKGCIKCLQLLVAHKANIHITNDYGETPLHVAALYNNPECITYLISLGADVNQLSLTDQPPAYFCGIPLFYVSGTPLHLAVQQRKEAMKTIHTLIEHGADPRIVNARGQNVFKLAQEYGHEDNIECLLRSNHNYLLRQAVIKGDVNTLKSWIKDNQKVNRYAKNTYVNNPKYSGYPLTDAIEHNQYEVAKILIINCAPLNMAYNEDGQTPLHLAAKKGNAALLKFMLERGAEQYMDDNGTPPFHLAAIHGDVECLRLLCRHKNLVNHPNSLGETALHLASRYNHPDCVEYLLTAWANINLQSHRGDGYQPGTPLHLAAQTPGAEATIARLMSLGGNMSLRNKNGFTPKQLALACNYPLNANAITPPKSYSPFFNLCCNLMEQAFTAHQRQKLRCQSKRQKVNK